MDGRGSVSARQECAVTAVAKGCGRILFDPRCTQWTSVYECRVTGSTFVHLEKIDVNYLPISKLDNLDLILDDIDQAISYVRLIKTNIESKEGIPRDQQRLVSNDLMTAVRKNIALILFIFPDVSTVRPLSRSPFVRTM